MKSPQWEGEGSQRIEKAWHAFSKQQPKANIRIPCRPKLHEMAADAELQNHFKAIAQRYENIQHNLNQAFNASKAKNHTKN